MLNLLRSTATGAAIAAAGLAAAPERAEALDYPIDCAILLCLSGGWPASTPCALARAEFIRRITPWPIEPPLQIWRCPMGASFEMGPADRSTDRIWDVLLKWDDVPLQSHPAAPLWDAAAPATWSAVVRHEGGGSPSPLPEGFALQFARDEYANEEGSADIDISGPAFDFIRSIRVFNVTAHQQQSFGNETRCLRSDSVRMGSYGAQGDYRWSRSSTGALPEAHTGLEGYGSDCPEVIHRSVFVEWRDYEGNYGYEQVNY